LCMRFGIVCIKAKGIQLFLFGFPVGRFLLLDGAFGCAKTFVMT
jgi:hypothetical protein